MKVKKGSSELQNMSLRALINAREWDRIKDYSRVRGVKYHCTMCPAALSGLMDVCVHLIMVHEYDPLDTISQPCGNL